MLVPFCAWRQGADITTAWANAIAAADEVEARGNYIGELTAPQTALTVSQRLGENNLRLAYTYERLGAAYAERGQLREAEKSFLRSLQILMKVPQGTWHKH